jgi:hypothetical protein
MVAADTMTGLNGLNVKALPHGELRALLHGDGHDAQH